MACLLSLSSPVSLWLPLPLILLLLLSLSSFLSSHTTIANLWQLGTPDTTPLSLTWCRCHARMPLRRRSGDDVLFSPLQTGGVATVSSLLEHGQACTTATTASTATCQLYKKPFCSSSSSTPGAMTMGSTSGATTRPLNRGWWCLCALVTRRRCHRRCVCALLEAHDFIVSL